MRDASFLDGKEKPIRLIAQDEDDAKIISALIQDSIAERKEMLHEQSRHEFSLLLRRFRWEDVNDAQNQKRNLERVQSVLSFKSVEKVQYSGFDSKDQNLAFDLIGLIVEKDNIRVVFAGNGEIKLSIETIDIVLSDVSRPYSAKVQNIPKHMDDE